MKERIEQFLAEKSLVVVGVSSRPQTKNPPKFGNYAVKELRQRGYELWLVHPTAAEIEGVRCYPSLQALKGKARALWLCVPPDRGLAVLTEAKAAGIERVWIQQGAESATLLGLAEEQGLEPVWGRCILMYAPPVRSFHAFHRFFVKLFGRLYAVPKRPVHALPPGRIDP